MKVCKFLLALMYNDLTIYEALGFESTWLVISLLQDFTVEIFVIPLEWWYFVEIASLTCSKSLKKWPERCEFGPFWVRSGWGYNVLRRSSWKEGEITKSGGDITSIDFCMANGAWNTAILMELPIDPNILPSFTFIVFLDK